MKRKENNRTMKDSWLRRQKRKDGGRPIRTRSLSTSTELNITLHWFIVLHLQVENYKQQIKLGIVSQLPVTVKQFFKRSLISVGS